MPVSECGDHQGQHNDLGADTCGRNLRITVCANQGGRKYMEDRVQVECVRSEDGSIDYTYIAVYDGHGGAEASEYVRRHLLKNIQAQNGFDGDDDQMLAAIKSGFIETHLAMWKVVDEWPLTASGYTSTAGTTASCAFIRRGKLFTAHVGDSAIILGRKQGGCIIGSYLTVDHKPDSAEEEQRINGAGGMIMRKSGVMRVVWTRPIRGHVGPVRRSTPTESIAFLAVARALGDLWSYNQDTKQFIVSPEPDVSVLELDADDKFIVLASDGLTNVLKAQQVADIVYSYESEGCDEGGLLPNHSRWLLRYALRGWGSLRADNISVVTVMLDDGKEESLPQISNNVILSSDVNLNLEEVFTKQPTSMVRITPFGCQKLLTIPIELVYAGAVDFNFGSGVEYKGPGFSHHTRIPQAMLTDAVPRLVPVLPFRRIPSLSSISNLFSHVASPQQTPTDITDKTVSTNGENETVAQKYEITNAVSMGMSGGFGAATSHEGIVSRLQQPDDTEVGDEQSTEQHPTMPVAASRKRRFSVKSLDGSVNAPTPLMKPSPCVDLSTGKAVKFYCRKHGLSCANVRKRNEGYATSRKLESECAVVSDLCDKGEQEMTDDEQRSFTSVREQPVHVASINEEHAYASSSANDVTTVVSPITTTPLSGRKRLVAIRRTPMFLRRRGQARRNLIESHVIERRNERIEGTEPVKGERDEDSTEEEPKVEHSQLELVVSSSVPKPSPQEATLRSSLGGASALSPALMLATLRAPDRILHAAMKDPISRDISLCGLRSSWSRSVSFGHAPVLSPLKRLNVTDDSFESKPLDGVPSDRHLTASVQKRKVVDAQESTSQSGPPAKRSRFWGFFTNMLGGRSASK
ncbi:Protein phosphatase 1D [Toxocara canis]|uniref:Protein phosphatase 1D n=1 Tax=Toxocara canis TaxID=6265 RepID=A0A0B2VV00_TOXCA|nr:Protein phosphatase 1D [Toxocara canis]